MVLAKIRVFGLRLEGTSEYGSLLVSGGGGGGGGGDMRSVHVHVFF